MRPSRPILWATLFFCLWTSSLAGVKKLRLSLPTSETIAAVAREMGAATFQESLEEQDQEQDQEPAASEGRRVQRKLITGGEDIEDNTEYQEYQGVMGRPGVDFPVLPSIPTTAFSCRAVKKPGYYADLDTDCQVFHICDGGRKISFLCPNGTIFRQSHLICDWWFRVDCGKSVELYEESAEQLAADQRVYKQRAEALGRAVNKGDQQGETLATQREIESSSPKPDTHIDAPFFETAKLNYKNRQSARKQQASQQIKQLVTPVPEVENIHFEAKNVNQLQYKNSQDTRPNKPVDEENEQQILSETASFASSRGSKFGRQFYQENYFTPSSQLQSGSTEQRNQPNYQTNDNDLQLSSKAPQPQTSINLLSSSTVSENSFSFPTSTVSSLSSEGSFQSNPGSSTKSNSEPSPPRNFRPIGRLLPTSSQNSNLRQSSGRNNFFRSNKQTSTTKNVATSKQTPSGVPINTPSTPSQSEFSSPQSMDVNSVSPSFVPQKNFIRPSPDLIPPEQSPTTRQNGRLQAQANIYQNSKTYVQFNRNRTATTSKSLVVESSVNRFSSPTTLPSIQETTASPRQRQKQRRFTSTTQKPVFTAKFKPSKSFSYVELERSKTSQESATQPTESSSTLASFSPIIDSRNKVENVHFGLDENIHEQFSTSSYSTSNTPTSVANTKESISTFSTLSSTSPYSPTIPDRPDQFPSQKLVTRLEPKQTTSSVPNSNNDSRLDKLASFSNIDPAEINLLPSNTNKGTRSKLMIPDSSGPNALHTLALYYATSEADSGTTPAYNAEDTFPPQSTEDFYNFSSTGSEESDSKVRDILKTHPKQVSKISDEILLRSHSGSPDNETEIDNVKSTVDTDDAVKDISTVLTKATKDSYASLFNDTEKKHSHGDDMPCTGDDIYDLDAGKEALTEKNEGLKEDVQNDLDIQQSRGIVQPLSSTKKPFIPLSSNVDDLPDELKLRDSTDLRELAQVFSRALSAYLEDPDSFRRILSEVRPTEPTSASGSDLTQNLEENEDEVLDFSDASNRGPRIITNNQLPVLNQQSQINSLDIKEINSLARENYTTGQSTDASVKAGAEENSEGQAFSTANPTSLAVDINYLLSNNNNVTFDSVTEDSYLPTVEIEEDKSRWGRYGGFHNNSVVSEYQPYGSDVSNTVTGRPITETTFVTEGSSFDTTLDEAQSEYFTNKNVSTAASNQIDIESIPEQLGIVPAQDINALVEDHNDCNDPSHNHGDHLSSDSIEHKPFLIQTEEEIYGRGTDQEKVLIASGSQSFVSRDNYVRILGAKHEFDTKNSVASKVQNVNENSIRPVEPTTTTQKTTTMKSRGSVRFGPPSTADRSDISSFRRRPNKEITFQNVNLGNGVTLERTKTIRYSTPEIQNVQRSTTYSPDININPVSINEGLSLVSNDVVSTTEHPLQASGSTRSIIRATTYHPSSSLKPDLPDVIPPRGSLRNSWQWNARPSSNADITTPESLINTILNNENFASSPQDFSTFASTLLPPNVTLETAKEEMLEKKAEEIFGKLNETSANMLMNVMNQAESNTTVRRLVLLLVADRNGKENKSFEDSRNQLIQALLKTTAPEPTTAGITESTQYEDKKSTTKKSGRTRTRSRGSSTTTTQSSTTSRSRNPKSYRGTDPDVKTITSNDASNKPEPQFLRSPNLFPQNPSASSFGSDPDARAVELLKSLYHLAARWG
ncbi:mucin-3A-like [Macrosteles quadrilineatus]|uniref:mucin-3A-like n=1 Tax=Macrosteles quadrilineatus TaxID=74068 RepID=UPI0023E24859|nr:mucin-3A-like [Macrosteles quadrilineatus]